MICNNKTNWTIRIIQYNKNYLKLVDLFYFWNFPFNVFITHLTTSNKPQKEKPRIWGDYCSIKHSYQQYFIALSTYMYVYIYTYKHTDTYIHTYISLQKNSYFEARKMFIGKSEPLYYALTFISSFHRHLVLKNVKMDAEYIQ